MTQRYRFALVIASIVIIYSSTARSWSEEGAEDTVFTLHSSVELSVIEKQLNVQIPQHLHEIRQRNKGPCVNLILTKACADIDSNGWVKRNGKILVKGLNNSISIDIPVRAKVVVRGTGEIGKHIRETAVAAMVVNVELMIGIKDDWEVSTTVNSRYHWTKTPRFNIAGIRITFQEQVDTSIKVALSNTQHDIEREIASRLNLKTSAEKIWKSLFKDIVLDRSSNTLLTIRPKGVYVSPISVSSRELIMEIQVATRSEIKTNTDFNQKYAVSELPNISVTKFGDGNINFPIYVDNDLILDAMNRMLSERELDFYITQLSTKKDRDDNVAFDLKVKKRGFFSYFYGDIDIGFSAEMNVLDNVFKLFGFEFGSCGQNELSCAAEKSMSAVFNGSSKAFEIDINNDVEKTSKAVIDSFEKIKVDFLHNGIELTYDVNEVTLRMAVFDKGRVKINVKSSLDVSLRFVDI